MNFLDAFFYKSHESVRDGKSSLNAYPMTMGVVNIFGIFLVIVCLVCGVLLKLHIAEAEAIRPYAIVLILGWGTFLSVYFMSREKRQRILDEGDRLKAEGRKFYTLSGGLLMGCILVPLLLAAFVLFYVMR